MNLAYALSDAFVARCVGHEALARGFVLAQSGAVSDLHLDLAGHTITALVQGSEASPYQVSVDLALQGKGLHYGTCSCYVGQNCKHAAAVLLRLRIQLAEQHPHAGSGAPGANGQARTLALPPAWERSLDQIVSSTRPPVLTRPDEIGLRIEATSREPHKPLRLHCRPVRRGPSGNWVQDGISWSLLEYDWDSRHEPTQRDLLVQLSRIGRAADRYTYYGRGDWVDLADITRSVWSVLADLAASGVGFVPAGGRKSSHVVVSAAPAALVLDLRQATLDGDLELSPMITVGEREPDYRRVGFIGHPAHGLVLESGDGSLQLAPLDGMLDHGVQEWLEQQHEVTIPAADRERFVAEFVPRLRRKVGLVSSDGAVEVPDVPQPVLSLAVTHGGAGEVDLGFAMRYQLGDHEQDFAPQDRLEGLGLRELAAEDKIVERLRLGASWPRLVDPAGRPQALIRLRGLEAARFCETTLPELIAAGVQVSQTGVERDYRRTEAAPQISFSTAEIEGADAASDWFDLIVDVRMDGELVPFDQLFRALATGEEFLITETGVYFDLDRPEFGQLLELITEAKSLQDRERSGLRINLLSQSLWDDLVAGGSIGVQAERWQRAVEALNSVGPPPEVVVPQGLKAELRPYQRDGFAWLWQLWTLGVGGILADDMGLGKTVQALALICAVREQSAEPVARPFLVVAPTSVVGNWASEAAKFAPGLQVVTVEASERKRRQPLSELVADADIVITSYTLARIDADHYAAIDWQGLFLDEAQFVKNHQAKTYTAIRRLGVGFTVAITGTPLENSLMDLWSMLSLTAPGMFPSPSKFTSYYRTPIERGEAPERLARLRQRIKPVMLRRTKDLVAAELPAKQEQVLEIDLHARHARIYQTHLQRERQRILGLIEELDENRITILSSLTLLRQLSLDAALIDRVHEGVPSGKVEVLMELLPELAAEGHRALVFSQFTSFLHRIGDRLSAAGIDYAYLDGSTRNRAAVIDGFRNGDAGVFLISLKAGGFGLNLTEADYCFVCDPWWNPAAEAQAVDRAHRIGQTRPVMVYRLVSKDTIEDKVMQLKARKEQLFSSVLAADGLPAGALTSEDIRGLLAG